MSESSEPDSRRTAEQWLDLVVEAERRGELLTAYDLARRGMAAFPDDLWLKHRAVLVLARSGATDQARQLFRSFGLDDRLEEDIAALGARLAKDFTLAATGPERQRRAESASQAYGAVYERSGGYYPGINAATLALVAGTPEKAAELSRHVLESCNDAEAKQDGEDFYLAATRAEAKLLLGETDAAGAALERAAKLHGGDYGAVATARGQLRLICDIKDIDPSVLSPLKTPTVIHFVGHMIRHRGRDTQFAGAKERALAERVAAALAARNVGYGYGSLASGADIIVAEALLAHGAELHVVLPFDEGDFKKVSVAPGGAGWLARFNDCLGGATSITYATEDGHLGDDALFSYGGQLAMGLALLRAGFLDTTAEQLALWDGRATGHSAGTAVEVAFWRELGLHSEVIECERLAGDEGDSAEPGDEGRPELSRVVRAMLFGDVKGFAKLRDSELPRFVHEVMGRFAEVLDRYGTGILYRNTWGDAIYIVLPDATTAARCALDLQHAMATLDRRGAGLPQHLELRLGGHLGPVFEGRDPVLRGPAFYGAHVSRTARIEPVTPPGEIYVTEAFAAALALDRDAPFACEYVGHMETAKGFGTMRMYVPKRRT